MDEKHANPSRCLLCHGVNLRPNWDAYNFWPGSFGSLTRLDESVMRVDKPEFRIYVDFRKGNREKGLWLADHFGIGTKAVKNWLRRIKTNPRVGGLSERPPMISGRS